MDKIDRIEKMIKNCLNWHKILQISLVLAIVYLLLHDNTEGWGWLMFLLFLIS